MCVRFWGGGLECTGGGGSEGFDGLHEGHRDGGETDVAEDDVDAEYARHGEHARPSVRRLHIHQRLQLQSPEADWERSRIDRLGKWSLRFISFHEKSRQWMSGTR